MTLQEQYDRAVNAAMSERDFRLREALFAKVDQLRRRLNDGANAQSKADSEIGQPRQA